MSRLTRIFPRAVTPQQKRLAAKEHKERRANSSALCSFRSFAAENLSNENEVAGVWDTRLIDTGLQPGGTEGRKREAVSTAFTTRGKPRGFTLIELVIASALMSLILVSAYLCLQAALASRKTIEPRLEVFQNARVAMALMTADLRAACSASKDFDFLGMHRRLGETEADNLDFATHNYTPRRPREGDFCQTSYYLDPDPETGQFGLWRRRNPHLGLDPLSGGSKQEIASGLVGLRFEYFDGLDWYDSWGDPNGRERNSQRDYSNLTGLPEAVRITLWFSAEPGAKRAAGAAQQPGAEPPLVFQTVARLNLAEAVRDSANAASAAATTDSTGSGPGPSNPGTPP
jgi:prepilin-type N-terminal cleavage/methylation domain-containing protein